MLRLLAAFAALLLAGCGYIGDPMPPLANVPRKVRDLAAVQRGSNVIVQFTVPANTTEDHPIPAPVKLDLRAGAADHFEENQWAGSARQIPSVQVVEGVARFEVPANEWVGKEIIFGVRVVAGNGKQSGWSNFVVVPVMPPPARPAGVLAQATAGGVRLTWQAPGSEFRVLRKAEGAADYTLAATVQKPEYLDATAEFGKPYSYMVQTIARQGDKLAESELSAAVSITPVDTFAPAAPAGLHASAAPNSIELSWERNTEADLNGYRIYRALGSGELEKLADISVAPSYSDRAVEAGKTYRYAITALDRAGNESARSPVLEVAAP
uniref:Fibronectin, type III domain protein n=1 Tax=Solibacter usitatus (strain Ellin6076) TaxID=234267 RepID=Q02A64_SOLUE